MRGLLIGSLVLCSGLTFAGAGPLGGISLRAGFFQTPTFDGTGSTPRVKLEGFSLGADWGLFAIPSVGELSISPTILFGGSNRRGKDQDATVYRLLATARVGIPTQKVYGLVGMGYATSKTRGGTSIDTKASFVTQLGIGTDFGPNLIVAKPFVQLSTTIANKPQYRGWLFEIGVRF